MKFISLCSGCGGMDLGLKQAGMKCIGQVENMPYALKLLKRHWSDVPKHTDIQTLFVSGSPARTYLEQTRKEKVLQARDRLSSLTVCESLDYLHRNGYSSKMFPDYFQFTAEGTLQLSCGKFPKAGTGIHGEFLTVNISDSPRDANVCSLSDVLEQSVPLKYYLTERAISGMIRRSEAYGRGGYVFIQSEGGAIRRLKRISLQRFKELRISGEENVTRLRKLTPTEKERLQGFPEGWTLPEESC